MTITVKLAIPIAVWINCGFISYIDITHNKLKSRMSDITKQCFVSKNGNRRHRYQVFCVKNKYVNNSTVSSLIFVKDSIFSIVNFQFPFPQLVVCLPELVRHCRLSRWSKLSSQTWSIICVLIKLGNLIQSRYTPMIIRRNAELI